MPDAKKKDTCCRSDFSTNPGDLARGYRRALWWVAILNLGYGLAEATAGLFAHSEALKADALDLLGDGSITALGLLALTKTLIWRARVALAQGIFLGILGFGVVGSALFRTFVRSYPAADMMGVFAALALLVNIACAVFLIHHRHGDANVRAVWLFSRNDAIGNIMVLVAAGLVAWSGSHWPDLCAALIVASLFLHSSWSIIAAAREDLQKASLPQTDCEILNKPKRDTPC